MLGTKTAFWGLAMALQLNLCESSNSLGVYLVMYFYAISDIAHTLKKTYQKLLLLDTISRNSTTLIYLSRVHTNLASKDWASVIIAQKSKPISSAGF